MRPRTLRPAAQAPTAPTETASAAVPPDATPADAVPVALAVSPAAVPAPAVRAPLGAANSPTSSKESRIHIQLRSVRQSAAEWGCSASGLPLLPIKESARRRVEPCTVRFIQGS